MRSCPVPFGEQGFFEGNKAEDMCLENQYLIPHSFQVYEFPPKVGLIL